jgi:cytochrome c biogenesis protein
MSRVFKPLPGSANPAIRWLWRLLTSVKLALALILVIAVISLIGIVLDQAPAHLSGDLGGKAWWLEAVARPRYGALTDVLDSLGLFQVFTSPWFLVPVALLSVSILACSVNRWQRIRHALSGGPVRHSPEFYTDSSGGRQFSFSQAAVPDLAGSVRDALKRKGYRVRFESSAEGTYLAADKNRYPLLGTYLGHLSLVLIIVGFTLSSNLGFRNVSLVVPEGSVRDVGQGTGLALSVTSFTEELWPGGEPKDFRSDVTLYHDGEEVKQGTIRVNHPMSYAGVRFYQSSYGPAAAITVENPEGVVLYDDVVALSGVLESPPLERPVGSFTIPGNGSTVYLIGTALNDTDPSFNSGEIGVKLYRNAATDNFVTDRLELGVTRELGGLRFTYAGERQYSGFEVSRDPGNKLIWIGSGLLLIGLFAVLYFPHRQVWALVQEDGHGGGKVHIREGSARRTGAASELEALSEDIGERLSAKDAASGRGS